MVILGMIPLPDQNSVSQKDDISLVGVSSIYFWPTNKYMAPDHDEFRQERIDFSKAMTWVSRVT
jgi:hypothetical protein